MFVLGALVLIFMTTLMTVCLILLLSTPSSPFDVQVGSAFALCSVIPIRVFKIYGCFVSVWLDQWIWVFAVYYVNETKFCQLITNRRYHIDIQFRNMIPLLAPLWSWRGNTRFSKATSANVPSRNLKLDKNLPSWDSPRYAVDLGIRCSLRMYRVVMKNFGYGLRVSLTSCVIWLDCSYNHYILKVPRPACTGLYMMNVGTWMVIVALYVYRLPILQHPKATSRREKQPPPSLLQASKTLPQSSYIYPSRNVLEKTQHLGVLGSVRLYAISSCV